MLAYLLSSCTTYKAYMSEPSKDPVANKLPKMEFEWFTGSIQGANEDFVKNIVRNEINQNIISSEGQKQGTIEVTCDKLVLKQNLALAGISGGTLFVLNILGMPFTSTKIDMTITYKILDINGELVDTRTYSTYKKSVLGFYYGKDAAVCLVEATKDVTKRFRDDVNTDNSKIIAKLEDKYASPSNTYYAHGNNANHTKKKTAVQSDVDLNIPQGKNALDDTYVLIIANEDYQFVDPVNFAAHDGEIFKEYCIKTLGVPEKQIRYCPNASYGVISGGVDWLKYALNNFEGSRAIVYYCGHGIPDEKTNEAYIIPVDGKGTNTATCYSLNTLYKTLAATKAANVTYFMDACFTGANKEGSMLVAARGVAREAKKETIEGKAVVFSASSADETAMTYPEKGHGLFTYFLLKKLQESKGAATYEELAVYINQHVKKEAFLINEKPQTPVVATSPKSASSWKAMKLK